MRFLRVERLAWTSSFVIWLNAFKSLHWKWRWKNRQEEHEALINYFWGSRRLLRALLDRFSRIFSALCWEIVKYVWGDDCSAFLAVQLVQRSWKYQKLTASVISIYGTGHPVHHAILDTQSSYFLEATRIERLISYSVLGTRCRRLKYTASAGSGPSWILLIRQKGNFFLDGISSECGFEMLVLGGKLQLTSRTWSFQWNLGLWHI